MPIKKNKTFLCLGLFFCLSQNCFGQATSNIELITSLTDSLLEQGFTELSLSARKQAAIRSANDNELNWILEDRLIKTLTRFGYGSVFHYDAKRDSTPSGALLLFEYGISKLTFRVERASDDSASLKRKIAEVSFFLKVRDGVSGPIIYDRFFEGSRRAKPQLSLSTGQARKEKKRGKVLQPVLISTVTAVIVYLFYALRSR